VEEGEIMTHKEITDPELRAILANELNIIRKALRTDSDALFWVRLGLDTALRRVQFVQDKKASGDMT
jgi:hypothetical protein